MTDSPTLAFATAQEWETYLSHNATTSTGVWLKLAKKTSGVPSVTYEEALEVALMFGWIDGQKKPFDDSYWLQKFTPRRAKSIWSKRNCQIAERLIKDNRMQPSGLSEVEAAKKDGRWEQAYDSPQHMVVPDDFLRELAKDKQAEAFFKTLNKANIYAIAWRLQTAKKPEIREKRMKTLLAMLAKGEKLH